MTSSPSYARGKRGGRRTLIWTNGVFSMEGAIAKLPELVQIARDHDAILAVDDSHSTGVLGEHGRGTAEHFGLLGEIDIITSTLGKALGGASGGFVAASEAVTDMLTQPVAPATLFERAAADGRRQLTLAAVRFIEKHPARVQTLRENTHFREQINPRLGGKGFKPLAGETPIVPIIVGETSAGAIRMSDMMLDEGVFVTGFGYPVVPHGVARVQMSAALEEEHLEQALEAFERVGRELGLI